ncbi:exosporium protein C [Bacillus toyonensis]|nr:exosporium protein C [Bacillus toyonensis]
MTTITHIIDYQAIQPINKTDATTFTIPDSPNKAILANIELKIPIKDSRNNRVELIATVGVKGITDISQILFRVFRNNIEIFHTQVSIRSTDSEQYYVETFQTINKNISCGIHEYTLTVENLTSAASADVIGPLTFSALAIGQGHNSY